MDALKFSIGDFLNQPNVSKQDALSYFFRELEIDRHIASINNEVIATVSISKKIRPLSLKKKEFEEQMKGILQLIELEVATTYPPRQGTDREREALRSKLKKENEEYQQLDGEFRKVTERIFELELELSEVQMQAKNARRITETFDSIMRFITEVNLGGNQ